MSYNPVTSSTRRLLYRYTARPFPWWNRLNLSGTVCG